MPTDAELAAAHTVTQLTEEQQTELWEHVTARTCQTCNSEYSSKLAAAECCDRWDGRGYD